MKTALERMGNAAHVISSFGTTDSMLRLIGGIAVLASNTENWVERAIWRVEGIDPAGIRPSTDGKQISGLIKQLAAAADNLSDGQIKSLVHKWCLAAGPAYRCRNSIFHATTVPLGKMPWFASNAAWHGEMRKRPFSDFHADDNTLSLLQGAFGVLLQSIQLIATSTDKEPAGSQDLLEKLGTAHSIVCELQNLAAAINHEKY